MTLLPSLPLLPYLGHVPKAQSNFLGETPRHKRHISQQQAGHAALAFSTHIRKMEPAGTFIPAAHPADAAEGSPLACGFPRT